MQRSGTYLQSLVFNLYRYREVTLLHPSIIHYSYYHGGELVRKVSAKILTQIGALIKEASTDPLEKSQITLISEFLKAAREILNERYIVPTLKLSFRIPSMVTRRRLVLVSLLPTSLV
jgi:hypothetical protein